MVHQAISVGQYERDENFPLFIQHLVCSFDIK
jgi:hypothetical protein